jgi:hypothetical protein
MRNVFVRVNRDFVGADKKKYVDSLITGSYGYYWKREYTEVPISRPQQVRYYGGGG